VISANNNNDSKTVGHVTPAKIIPPSQLAGDAVTSPGRCDLRAGGVPAPGLVEVKSFNHAQPVYYNQAQCVPLYGQYPGLYHGLLYL